MFYFRIKEFCSILCIFGKTWLYIVLHDFNLTYYSSIILGSFNILLFPKLCWHIGLTPSYVSIVQLVIDHDDDVGITFDKYGPDRLDNSFSSGESLSSGIFFLWVIGRKYFNIPCPDIT